MRASLSENSTFLIIFIFWLVLVIGCAAGKNTSTSQSTVNTNLETAKSTPLPTPSSMPSPSPTPTPDWRNNIKGLGGPNSLPDEKLFTATPSWLVVVKMLRAWKAKQWQAMASLTQQSWRDDLLKSGRNPTKHIEDQFSFMTLLGAENVSGVLLGPNMAEIKADLYLSIGDEVHKKRMTVNVIQEDGQWGFNPISAMRMEDLK